MKKHIVATPINVLISLLNYIEHFNGFSIFNKDPINA